MYKWLATSLLFFATITFAATPTPTYHRIVVFGDSYSDNGNVFRLSEGQYPNAERYFKGRFSDGPVWSEYLAQNFNLDPENPQEFIDLAYGQAKILSPTSIEVIGNPNKTYSIPDLTDEINTYVKEHKNFNNADLIIVFIGTNDFFDVPKMNDKTFFQHMANQEVRGIQRLIKLGAEHIIVLNGRNVTYSQLASLYAQKNAKATPLAQAQYFEDFAQLIQAYNQQLASDLKGKTQVFIYDTYAFDNVVLAKIKQGGFKYNIKGKTYVLTEAKNTCYQNNQGDYQHVAGPVCKNPENYFFYDRIHTTSNVGYLLAEDVYQQFIKATQT